MLTVQFKELNQMLFNHSLVVGLVDFMELLKSYVSPLDDHGHLLGKVMKSAFVPSSSLIPPKDLLRNGGGCLTVQAKWLD